MLNLGKSHRNHIGCLKEEKLLKRKKERGCGFYFWGVEMEARKQAAYLWGGGRQVLQRLLASIIYILSGLHAQQFVITGSYCLSRSYFWNVLFTPPFFVCLFCNPLKLFPFISFACLPKFCFLKRHFLSLFAVARFRYSTWKAHSAWKVAQRLDIGSAPGNVGHPVGKSKLSSTLMVKNFIGCSSHWILSDRCSLK